MDTAFIFRPALFLDRDGVINVDKHYVHQREDFEFNDGIFELCRLAADRGMAIVVVTNQAGIGRGFYSEQQFHDLTNWMCDQFAMHSVTIDAVYFCPYHAEHGIGRYAVDSFDRKPNPGMILRAQADLDLDLPRSILIGDKPSDIAAAKAAGVGLSVLLTSEFDAQMIPLPDICIPTLQALNEYLATLGEPFKHTTDTRNKEATYQLQI
ncbi:HAD family hydrolase [Chitinivorax sp. B]|uniref:D-glycero-alpha-D-manno-heptose-1,7-bisphosphate 7-phosphatase n=1 Tax=Chitinivorax sp. B TaxID=2502235 RepID=UPI0014852476|nr:HAD family hydrolase [Chitinivorax sp. B]